MKPFVLVDEVSTTEYYVGTSNNGSITSGEIWQIKRIIKQGNVWSLAEYPNGSQEFSFVWEDRAGYSYQ